MKMRYFFLLIALILANNCFSQKFNQNFYTDIYSYPISDSSIQIYYFYKVPVKNIIFAKSDNSYSAFMQIAVELTDSNSNFIKRQLVDRKIIYDEFANTISSTNYIEGFIQLQAPRMTLKVVSSFFDGNSQKEIFRKEQYLLRQNRDSTEFLPTLIVRDEKILCDNKMSYQLPNFGGVIPFDNIRYDILIPHADTYLEDIFVKIISLKDTIFHGLIQNLERSSLNFSICDEKVFLDSDSSFPQVTFFLLDSFSERLREGPAEIIVSRDESFNQKKSHKLLVKWLDKPKSLNDPETALKRLKIMIGEDSVKQILKSDESYEISLNNFWKKLDPTPSTEYNELTAEYYERVDYCIKNFSSITGVNGADSDRAKVYIHFGKPNLVERGSNDDGNIFESWIYSKLNKKYIFVDERGTGEFILESAL